MDAAGEVAADERVIEAYLGGSSGDLRDMAAEMEPAVERLYHDQDSNDHDGDDRDSNDPDSNDRDSHDDGSENEEGS